MDQNTFAASMGLRNQLRSNSDASGSNEEDRFSLENRFPISNEDFNIVEDKQHKDPVQQQMFLNKLKTEQMDKDDDEIIKKYEQHLKNGVAQMSNLENQNLRGMEGGKIEFEQHMEQQIDMNQQNEAGSLKRSDKAAKKKKDCVIF